MSSSLFKEDISNEILYNFLKINCKVENNYYILSKEIFKKYEYNNELNSLLDNLKNKYKKSKEFYINRVINYNNLLTIIRQICKLNNIKFLKEIKYNKNDYSIIYYIECDGDIGI
tara:strand:- start:15916 stop:16260 length:345 start_codon:yes stop_codon:yes gene_type:complete